VIPYATQTIGEEDIAAVRDVLTSGWLTQGPAVPTFERTIAQAHGVAHAVAVSNATAALHLACLAMDLSPGDSAWTSPISFTASANCALYCGASVDFVDIEPGTRNMSIEALREKLVRAEAQGKLPKIVIPVHFGGLPCDLAAMRELADRYGFRILADASHAVGAEYLGKPIGSEYADASVFSFHPVKIVTTGEGGAVVTQDARLARRVELLRAHGNTREPEELSQSPEGPWVYEQQALGFNYRLTDVQAALGTAQMARLPTFHARREALAGRYPGLLAGMDLELPVVPEGRRSSWHLYPVRLRGEAAKNRARIFASLRGQGIGVNVHYIPIHLQPYQRERGGFGPGYCPEAEAYYAGALSLPLFPLLTEAQQDAVARALFQALAE
jgi:UDP-4-amino-4,6-dideoxy-N-acetyl-beta-L-altrosamine transaminase